MPISREVNTWPARSTVSPRARSLPAKAMNCPAAPARRTLDCRGAVVIARFSVLDHDDGIGPARHHPTGRNQRRGTGCNSKLRHRAGSEDLAVQHQGFWCTFRRAHRIVGTYREPVDAGSIETGKVDISDNRTRQYTAERLRHAY
jgi:hypothetical protein